MPVWLAADLYQPKGLARMPLSSRAMAAVGRTAAALGNHSCQSAFICNDMCLVLSIASTGWARPAILASVYDVRAAIQFVRAESLGVDPERIGLLVIPAALHLVALVWPLPAPARWS